MISIIGGGPSGAYLASLLRADKVQIFEEHENIGRPVQCTGIVTSKIKELVSLRKEVIVNKIEKVKLISPGNEEYGFKLREPEFILDRVRFDSFLIDKAKDKGVEVFMKQRLRDIRVNENIDLDFENKKIRTDILVGADGVNSLVGRRLGLIKKRGFKIGYQYRVKGHVNDKEEYKVYFFERGFGWVVPENGEIARIGLVGDKKLFESFLKRIKIKIKKKNLVEVQSGSIPLYENFKAGKGNIYLVGDAAGHVKATTHGGIVYGMRGAKILAKVLNQGRGCEDYEKELGKMKRELWLHRKTHDFLNRFKEKDFDEFVKVLRKVKLGDFNRDEPFSRWGLFLKPSLMVFGVKMLLK